MTRHDFINYDDDLYVTANVHVQNGLTLENLKWAFSHVVLGNWHPVTVLSHMLDCRLFGLQPWGHHLTSLLLHALNTALVFLLLRTLTGAVWRSLLVAALFGWHPLRVESVAWVAERKDVLSAGFGFLSLLCYARYARGTESRIQKPESEIGSGGPSHCFRLLAGVAFFCLRVDEQADAGDVAVRDVAAGLLAAQTFCRWPVESGRLTGSEPSTFNLQLSTVDGKDSVLRPGGGGKPGDLSGAEAGRRGDDGGPFPAGSARWAMR